MAAACFTSLNSFFQDNFEIAEKLESKITSDKQLSRVAIHRHACTVTHSHTLYCKKERKKKAVNSASI